MVVDDEADIIEIVKRLLGRLGCSVFFTNPDVALEHFQRDAKKYGHILIKYLGDFF
jgi:CheY-like chemotaxis protein